MKWSSVAAVSAITLVLSQSLSAQWPLHPVGFILTYGWGLNWVWLSIFLGWLAKVVVVRFGGAQLLRDSRPFFIGLILGEAAGGLTWIAVSLVRLSMGLEYYAV